MHGNGNDFVIINNIENKHIISKNEIIQISDRHFGIGCDQFIILVSSTDYDIEMQIFNSDGSQSGACGNATRCCAYILENIFNIAKDEYKIKVLDRILICHKISQGNYMVNMGKANIVKNLDLNEINPNLPTVKAILVEIGNPHIVIRNIALDQYKQVSDIIQNSNYFVNGVNINFVDIIDKSNVKIVTYERGVGQTLSCGSGACSSFYALYKNNVINKECKFISFGGNLIISIDDKFNILMSGSVTMVASGKILKNT